MKQFGRFSKVVACVIALAAAFIASSAQATVGKAVVRAVRGQAQYAEGNEWMPLKVGQTLAPGTSLRTATDSQVDLFLGENGPLVRLTADTTMAIDKLNFDATGMDTVIETQLDLKSGRILGVVKKMAASSKYEVKTPNGVAGIRGTTYDISATTRAAVGEGSLVVVYVKADGTVITKVVNPETVFEPAAEDVRDMTPEEVATLTREINDLINGGAVAELPVGQQLVVYVSPTAGQD
jgi:FecR protein